MPLVKTEQAAPSRDRYLGVQLLQGAAGLALLILATWSRWDEARAILRSSPALLIPVLLFFALSLSLLRFPLSKDVFVAPAVPAYIAFIPIVGMVPTAWIAVTAAITTRLLSIVGIGPVKLQDDRLVAAARIFGLFGTYGPPLIFAAWVFERTGGVVPIRVAYPMVALQMAAALAAFMLLNVAVMIRSERALGYSLATGAKLAAIDTLIYFLALPYAVLIVLIWPSLQFMGLIPAVFSGIIGTFAVQNFANERTANRRLVERLASLSNIGTALSVHQGRDELLRTVYQECSKVLDVAIFGIALVDEETSQLHFVLDVRDGEFLPPWSAPLGSGLNSWVVEHRRPLLIRSTREEKVVGVASLDDGAATEAWLGVPMIVHDRIIGVIAVQSYTKGALTDDDVVLMGTVANQTAAAVEDARFYHELDELNARLEVRVAERTAELRETNQRLLAADRAKSLFLANMSHELRTPLNSIIGFSNILMERTRTLIPSRMYVFLENILASGSHLLTLINDILDLSKVEAGKLQLDLQTFVLREAIESVDRVVKGVAADSEISTMTAIDPRLGTVFMDEVKVKQVLINLMSNAVKFSPRGSIIQVRAEVVDRYNSPSGVDLVRLSVEDKGSGISPDDLSKIFQEFYQVAGVAAHRGTGLGLPLAKRLVELHGGTIAVRSQVGVGTTFVVELPLNVDVPTDPTPASTTMLAKQHPRTRPGQ
jgi:signal transduction histidine kinase